ncbi:MAG: carbohydrate ABC transporter permease [Candidatus Sumerlaeia bacterium]|nr:carbohydrate ABC transporter permease [Candidatus Sumerlaeia bacterium]
MSMEFSEHNNLPFSERLVEAVKHHYLRYIIMLAILVIFVGPFLWLFSISIRGEGNIYELVLIPANATLSNYTETWRDFGIAQGFYNSILVAIMTVGSNVLFCSLAAYPLARMEFPGSKIIFLLILSTLMIPFQLYMIPLFLLSLEMRLFDSLLGVVAPAAVGAFGIYLLKQYYHSIPNELEEAARIDGAGEFKIWALIMFPLTKPAVAALALFIFIQSWSNFLWPLIILYSEDKYTLPITIARLSGAFVDRTQILAAGSVIAVLPVIILFFFLQRFFLGGLSVGAVKG